MLAALFWVSAGLIVYTHLGYPLSCGSLARAAPRPRKTLGELGELPRVSLIVAAYDEEEVIEAKVANALALDYPRELLELIVASDGSADATAERARAAGADLVLELPRGGKLAAQNAAAEQASGDILAFSDANSAWRPDALRRLVDPFADGRSATPAVRSASSTPRATTSRAPTGATRWRSARWSPGSPAITAGNGAIYAVRASAYLPLAPSGSHDLSFPFAPRQARLRSLYVPAARAEEKMVPTLEGEFARKRRMMVGIWDIVVGEGMISPRGYTPLYAFELFSHRLLRYLTPFLHLRRLRRQPRPARQGWVYIVTYGIQLGADCRGAPRRPASAVGPLRVARYYAMTTLSIAAGLWDRFRHGPPAAWEKAPARMTQVIRRRSPLDATPCVDSSRSLDRQS